MEGIPLTIDLWMSPSKNSRSSSASRLGGPNLPTSIAPELVPRSLSFQDNFGLDPRSSTILVSSSSIPSLNRTFLVIRSESDLEPSPSPTARVEETLSGIRESFSIFYINYFFKYDF
ncbi:hypothetical protein ES288_A03G175200v1 [Gossypium darwinii]|uniref:Uncharacterized protein n=2 Tax=Gossypium TaxID=3633 RepID=A0A5D2RB98_GOSTO|nr:hypothetical protein ES288_A03G175200v1 [Gossypium darwinii]TYI36854.1 hypothetical protein ES332_A03G170200v1 [Gossypium tomentosum]